jgi:hypothetical protein
MTPNSATQRPQQFHPLEHLTERGGSLAIGEPPATPVEVRLCADADEKLP